MKNIHLAPTPQPSRLHLWTDENGTRVELCELEYSHTRNTQNIYITDHNLEFYQGWYFNTSPAINKAVFVKSEDIKELKSIYGNKPSHLEKIVITNDNDLISDGLQNIDDDFLEWFVAHPSCEEVFITDDYEQVNQENSITRGSTNVVCKYKLIIPEEPIKPFMDERREAIAWFNAKDDLDKSVLCFKYYGSINYNNYKSLTGRQIEDIWKGETEKIWWKVNNPQCKQKESCYSSTSKKCICPKEQPKKEKYEYIGECKGNDGNGCFMDACGHDCGCFRVAIATDESQVDIVFTIDNITKHTIAYCKSLELSGYGQNKKEAFKMLSECILEII